jgi:hypothetical protein
MLDVHVAGCGDMLGHAPVVAVGPQAELDAASLNVSREQVFGDPVSLVGNVLPKQPSSICYC